MSATRRILVVGSVALDSVRTPYGAAEEALGGSASYFSFSASHFAPVSLVAVVGHDFPAEHRDDDSCQFGIALKLSQDSGFGI